MENAFTPDPNQNQNQNINLTEFDEEFQNTAAPSFDEVPDGKYQVRIESVRLETASTGAPMIKYDLIVLTGPHEGRHIFKNSVISKASLPFVKGELKVLGVEPQRLSDIEGYFDSLLDQRLNITKRTKKEYSQVYFNSLITTPTPLSSEPGPF